jgi:hypothetical protein
MTAEDNVWLRADNYKKTGVFCNITPVFIHLKFTSTFQPDYFLALIVQPIALVSAGSGLRPSITATIAFSRNLSSTSFSS